MTPQTITRRTLAHGVHDWAIRLEKEAPLLEEVLSAAPSKRVLDLGCGSGRHVRYLAERGYEAIGIDASEHAIDEAQEEPLPEGAQFILTDLGAVERSVRGHFGGALCLGNTLPALLSPESVSRMLIGLRRRLLGKAPIVLHLLNYDRIFENNLRSLPVELLESDDGDIALMTLLEPRADGIVLHTTAALRSTPRADPAIEPIADFSTQLRGWRQEEVTTMLEVARFSEIEFYGDMARSPFDPHTSIELVAVAR